MGAPAIPLRWLSWLVLLALADVVFYVLLTPVWLGIRVAAWINDRADSESGDAAGGGDGAA